MSLFGMLLNWLRSKTGIISALFFLGLAGLVLANVFIRPHHAEFGLDAYPGFWAVFGLVGGLAMVIIMKKIVQPMISRGDDYYERNS
ncbi:hypothetical protein SAMN04488503_2580 [Humidesulfovibrio mexicanus]|jgi:hypothetical protein|uniref:Uncharacterized protein n=1 Tax=Humidesulfovibrio mexicanus TaxID=147047 RepID=A0A239BJW4_9BACT|nr:hypothetical protein [Humidesulfovibrio mexicanus]SNS07314.1 hypothetical protein SAMN04488503_2580 [Humidesulfovibrio mexicanus]